MKSTSQQYCDNGTLQKESKSHLITRVDNLLLSCQWAEQLSNDLFNSQLEFDSTDLTFKHISKETLIIKVVTEN